jgi:uncharacterized membrane protein
LSADTRFFVAAYLLGHGLIKILLVAGLWRGKRWVYPVACLVLTAFIGYQVYRLSHHFSTGLCVFTLLDAIIVALIWHEYQSKGRQLRAG